MAGGAGRDDRPDHGAARRATSSSAARTAFAELLEAVGAEPRRADAARRRLPIAAQVEMPADEKQRLLEATRTNASADRARGSLRKLLAGVKRSRELAERAKSNGHGSGRIGPPQR